MSEVTHNLNPMRWRQERFALMEITKCWVFCAESFLAQLWFMMLHLIMEIQSERRSEKDECDSNGPRMQW